MKYNIFINQKAVVDSGLNVDIIDLVIFDAIYYFMKSSSCKQIVIDNVPYYWISTNWIISELPILGIKTTRGITKRIDNLVNNKLLIRSEASQTMAKALYRKGENFEVLAISSTQNIVKPSNESLQVSPTNLGTDVPTPRNESSNPLGTDVPTPRNESSNYNITNNNTSNNITNKGDIPLSPQNGDSECPLKKIDFNTLLDLYHKTCPSLPKVEKMTDSRKKKVNARFKEMDSDINKLTKVFTKVEASDFLTGRIGDFKAFFNWIFENDNNWLKIYEGNYDNKPQRQTSTQSQKLVIPDKFK